MKKVSSDDLERARILANKRERMLRKEQQKGRARNNGRRKNKKKKYTRQGNVDGEISFNFNHDIDIYQEDNRNKMSQICVGIREFEGNLIHLSFKSDEMKISAAGMLLLYAEIYRKIEADGTKITCDYPANRKAEQVLQHIGFFEMIGKPERISPEEMRRKTDNDVNSWNVIIGDEFKGQQVSEFLEKIAPSMGKENKIYVAVKEMIGNAIDHAYEKDATFRPWIAFGRISEEGKIIIVVGDLGKTIPTTITERSISEQYKAGAISKRTLSKKISEWKEKDSKLINIATKLNESMTMDSHRGVGFKNTIENIKYLKGELSIYSRTGSYISELSRDERRQYENKHAGVIRGTIVQIRIPLLSGNEK